MKRVPRLLLVAFALSLLAHLLVALILRPTTPTPEGQAEVVSIEHRPATIAVAKAPTPLPPKRTPAPRVASSSPPRPRKGPGETAASNGGSAAGPTPPHPSKLQRGLRASHRRRGRRLYAVAARHRRGRASLRNERHHAGRRATRRRGPSCRRERHAELRQFIAGSRGRLDGARRALYARPSGLQTRCECV